MASGQQRASENHLLPFPGPESCPEVGNLRRNSASGTSFSTAISDDADIARQRGLVTSSSSAGESRMSTLPSRNQDLGNLSADDPRNTKLDHFASFALLDGPSLAGDFTYVDFVIGCCRGQGKVEQHSWHRRRSRPGRDGQHQQVIVKRVSKEWIHINEGQQVCEYAIHNGQGDRSREDTLSEAGVYCILCRRKDVPIYLLKMLAIFQEGPDVWLVLEHADDGDLMNVVKQQVDGGGSLSMREVKTWMWQLLQAVLYLHWLFIGHRDISLENVVLRRGVVRLMDFGQAVLTKMGNGDSYRYFRHVGKPYYGGPETHPMEACNLKVTVPPGCGPGDVIFLRTPTEDLCEVRLPEDAQPGQPAIAQNWGYGAEAADVFACGVCFFILATGKPPWEHACLKDSKEFSGELFRWAFANGVASLARAWLPAIPDAATELLQSMMAFNPALRPCARECSTHHFFAALPQAVVPVHSQSRYFGDNMDVQAATEPQFDASLTRGDSQLPQLDASLSRVPVAEGGGTMLGEFYHENDMVKRSTKSHSRSPLSTCGGFIVQDPYAEELHTKRSLGAVGSSTSSLGTASSPFALSPDRVVLGCPASQRSPCLSPQAASYSSPSHVPIQAMCEQVLLEDVDITRGVAPQVEGTEQMPTCSDSELLKRRQRKKAARPDDSPQTSMPSPSPRPPPPPPPLRRHDSVPNPSPVTRAPAEQANKKKACAPLRLGSTVSWSSSASSSSNTGSPGCALNQQRRRRDVVDNKRKA